MRVKKQIKEENIRELFLKEFAITLARSMKIENIRQEIIPEQFVPIPVQTLQTQIQTSQKQQGYQPSIYKNQQQIPQKNLLQVPQPPKQKVPPTQISGLNSVTQFLNNPSIIGVESPGPGKPLLINRSGRIEPTNLMMTKESVDEIMQEISKQTRIPLISGVFKAVMGNYIITAIISDFVGTRFAIQKRMPIMAPHY